MILVLAEVASYVVGDQPIQRDLIVTLATVQAGLLVALAVVDPSSLRERRDVTSWGGLVGVGLWGSIGMLLAPSHDPVIYGRVGGIGLALILFCTVSGAAALFAEPKRSRR